MNVSTRTWVLHEDVKHEKLRPLNLSPQWFKLTPIVFFLSFSLSERWTNANPILTITEILITLHETLIISYLIWVCLSVCLTYWYNFNSDTILSYLLCNQSNQRHFKVSSENCTDFRSKMIMWISIWINNNETKKWNSLTFVTFEEYQKTTKQLNTSNVFFKSENWSRILSLFFILSMHC